MSGSGGGSTSRGLFSGGMTISQASKALAQMSTSLRGYPTNMVDESNEVIIDRHIKYTLLGMREISSEEYFSHYQNSIGKEESKNTRETVHGIFILIRAYNEKDRPVYAVLHGSGVNRYFIHESFFVFEELGN